jgi:hypothetical protein
MIYLILTVRYYFRVVSHISKFGDASKSPAGGATSPNFGICDTAVILKISSKRIQISLMFVE